jgi:hypothetical protein
MTKPSIFISHGNRDAKLAKKVAIALNHLGFEALRAFPEKAESGDSHPLANLIQGSYWQEASMDGKALFGRFAQTSG